MIGRCRNCAHWLCGPTESTAEPKWCQEADGGNARFFIELAGEGARETGASLMTDADFGCLAFEPKQGELLRIVLQAAARAGADRLAAKALGPGYILVYVRAGLAAALEMERELNARIPGEMTLHVAPWFGD